MPEVETTTDAQSLNTIRSNEAQSYWKLRVAFWSVGTVLAVVQAWAYRYFVTSDAIAYMDMSDGVLPGNTLERLINGVWSPLYPFLLGVARRIAKPNPIREIRFDHFVNIPIFLFAFACFELLLQSLWTDRQPASVGIQHRAVPRWAFLSLGYSVFLWASLKEITLQSLRPDMLMSGFLYLAVAVVVRMRGRAANWGLYLLLGAILGIGFLAKAPMLPIGLLILAISLLVVDSWRQALPRAIVAGTIFLLIGSLYYGPLSRRTGRLTLGDSSSFNYLVHVDGAGPGWYVTDMGIGAGKPMHSPHKIFDQPPAYEFAVPVPSTHPLRFDPSYWIAGVKARFGLRAQIRAVLENVRVLKQDLVSTGGLIAGFLLLCFVTWNRRELIPALLRQWPLILPGLAGIGMYTLVHVESRYVGAFFLLFWLGVIYASLTGSIREQRWFGAVVVAIALSIMIPLVIGVGYEFSSPYGRNVDGEVATALHEAGVQAGDTVARISTGGDLGWARAARVHIISEVDWQTGANTFWSSGPEVQEKVLQAFANTGVRAVVAHNWEDLASPFWRRLGKTHYWVYVCNQR